jgi:hypothetical protein
VRVFLVFGLTRTEAGAEPEEGRSEYILLLLGISGVIVRILIVCGAGWRGVDDDFLEGFDGADGVGRENGAHDGTLSRQLA